MLLPHLHGIERQIHKIVLKKHEEGYNEARRFDEETIEVILQTGDSRKYGNLEQQLRSGLLVKSGSA
jgi:hypothetical protein